MLCIAGGVFIKAAAAGMRRAAFDVGREAGRNMTYPSFGGKPIPQVGPPPAAPVQRPAAQAPQAAPTPPTAAPAPAAQTAPPPTAGAPYAEFGEKSPLSAPPANPWKRTVLDLSHVRGKPKSTGTQGV